MPPLPHLGDLADGQSETLTLTAQIDDAAPVSNTAEVTASGASDPDSTPDNGNPAEDDQDSVTVDAEPRADLSLNKVRLSGPDVNGDITYRILLSNAGPSTATGVAVTELPPGSATFVGATATVGTYDQNTHVWTVGNVAPSSSEALDITFNIPLDQFPAQNFAQVTAVNENDPDSQPGEGPLGPGTPPNQDDESTVTVTLSADLSLTKAETASPQFVGDQAVFEITVANAGPDPANDVQITDVLPAGLDYVSDSPTAGAYVPGTGVWTIPVLASGASETLTITADVIAPGAQDNTAEVTASGAPDPDSTPDNQNPAEDDQDTASITTTGGSLGDTVYFDVDGDGSQGASEPGLAGVDVTVIDAGPNGTLGDGPIALAAGEFAGESRTDLAVGLGNSSQVRLFQNLGGTLVPFFDVPVPGVVQDIALARINDDIQLDLVVAMRDPDLVEVYSTVTRGGPILSVPILGFATSLVTAGLNADKLIDIAVSHSTGEVTVLLNGAGVRGLSALPPVFVEPGLRGLSAGFIDSDSDTDLIAVSETSGRAHVLSNIGMSTGVIAPAYSFPVSAMPTATATAFIDEDGRTDLIVASKGDNLADVIINLDAAPGPPPTFTQQPTIVVEPPVVRSLITEGQNIRLQIAVTGTPPFSYAWFHDGMPVEPDGVRVRIDPATGSVVNAFAPSSGNVFGLAFVNGSLFTGDALSGQVFELDPDTGAVLNSFSSGAALTALGGDDASGTSPFPLFVPSGAAGGRSIQLDDRRGRACENPHGYAV